MADYGVPPNPPYENRLNLAALRLGAAVARRRRQCLAAELIVVGQNGLNNRLVNRAKADWHDPSAQLIPAEKILLMEAVGEHSPLARLIAQDQAKK